MTYIYKRKQASDLYHDLKKLDRNNFSYEGAAMMTWKKDIAA